MDAKDEEPTEGIWISNGWTQPATFVIPILCQTCDGSGEIQIDVRRGRDFYDCPMCEGDGWVTAEVLDEYQDGFITLEDAQERVIAMLTGEDR